MITPHNAGRASLHGAFTGFVCVPPGCRRDASSVGVDSSDILNHRRASVGVDTVIWVAADAPGSCGTDGYSQRSLKECARGRNIRRVSRSTGVTVNCSPWKQREGGNQEEHASIFEPKQRFHAWKTGQLVTETLEFIVTVAESTAPRSVMSDFDWNCNTSYVENLKSL